MSNIVPREVVTTGILSKVGVIGRIVRVRTRNINEVNTGKGNAKGKNKRKADGPLCVLELHISGGTTAADVIMFEVWDAALRQKLDPIAHVGETICIKNVLVKPHTDKTSPFTTSPLPVYLRAIENTITEKGPERPESEWPRLHPVTDVPDLQHLDNVLVCIAGRIVGETKLNDVPSSGSTVPVANTNLRVNDEMIRISGWRDHSAAVNNLTTGEIYYFEALSVRRLRQKDGKMTTELRFGSLTSAVLCPEPLRAKIMEGTGTNTEDTVAWTNISGVQRDYTKESVAWYTLSVCEAICRPEERRTLTLLAKVPSVFIVGFANKIIYYGCSLCKKAWHEAGENLNCKCTGATRVPYWKAVATLMDSSGQATATFFDAMRSIVEVCADNEPERMEPEYFADDDNLAALLPRVGAIPFTIVFSFDDSAYDTRPQLIARLVAPTFDERLGVRHPLDKMVQFDTPSFPCPPCDLTEVEFKQSIGRTLVPGGATPHFRTLLEVMDAPSGARAGEGAALRVTRRCACALRGFEATQTYNLVQNGPLEITSLLLQVRKSDYIHAIVSFRTSDELTLIAFWPVPTNSVTKFRQLFEKECGLHKEMADGSEMKLDRPSAETPLRIADRASAAAASCSVVEWGAHSSLEEKLA